MAGAHSSTRRARSAVRPHGFDMLRLIAAAAVLLGHSFLLPLGREPDPLRFGDYGFDFGRCGVVVFFVISGYLITGSWISDPNIGRYLEKRIRRIYPGLVVMLVLVVFVVGPIVTTDRRYFTDAGTWSFLVRNLLVVPYKYTLPGVFERNPFPYVNGVLWTLALEVLCYVAVGILGIMKLMRPWIALAIASIASILGWQGLMAHFVHGRLDSVVPLISMTSIFFAGSAARMYRWKFGPVLVEGAVAALALSSVFKISDSVILAPAATIVVIYIGTREWRWATAITRLGDPSYGIYIYGFVVQQLLVSYGLRNSSRAIFFLCSLLSATAMGYLSWHLVEHRALSRRSAVERQHAREASSVREHGVAPSVVPKEL